jgi:hypothetical protein
VSKKLEEKQQRRLAEERRKAEQKSAARKRNLITIGLAVLVGVLVVGLIITSKPGGLSGDVGVAEEEADCGPIETHELLGRNHVDEGTPIQYNSNPPTSGDHYQNFADPGFSREPIQRERLVHNLEHGQIVFWYRSEAPQATIDNIEAVVDSGGIGLLGTPYDELEASAEFTMTAWGASQSCGDVSQEVVNAFRERFQGQGPEQVGIPTFEGEGGGDEDEDDS